MFTVWTTDGIREQSRQFRKLVSAVRAVEILWQDGQVTEVVLFAPDETILYSGEIR